MEVPTIENIILKAEPSLTNHLVRKLVEQTICPVCQEQMFVPFMTKCGHNLCYDCITEWLQTNQTCPTCRGEIEEPPYLNLHIQNLVSSLVETTTSLCEDGKLPFEIKREMDMKLRVYKRDLKRDNLFKKIFKYTGHAVIDSSDGVARCSNCHWEVDGRVCLNCHVHLRNPYINEISSTNTSDLELEDYRRHTGNITQALGMLSSDDEEQEEVDEDGSDNSFINDDEIEILDYHDGLSDSEDETSRTSSPVRRTGYVPSILDDHLWGVDGEESGSEYEDWHGFQEDSFDENLDAGTSSDLHSSSAINAQSANAIRVFNGDVSGSDDEDIRVRNTRNRANRHNNMLGLTDDED